jgi:hypothetical protein
VVRHDQVGAQREGLVDGFRHAVDHAQHAADGLP